MQVTATDAKNRFGYYCSQAKSEPVIVEKDGRPDTVLLDYETFQALQQAAASRSIAQRKREFNETYREWIQAQKDHFDKHGLWCDGMVSWQQER